MKNFTPSAFTSLAFALSFTLPNANATSSVTCETEAGLPLVGVIFSHGEENLESSPGVESPGEPPSDVQTSVSPDYIDTEIHFEKNLKASPVSFKSDLGLSTPCMHSGLSAHNFKGESEFEVNPFDLCVKAIGPKSTSISFDSGAVLLNKIRVSDAMREQIAYEMSKILTQPKFYTKRSVKVNFQVLSRNFRIHFDPREKDLKKNQFAYTRKISLNGVVSENVVQVIPGIRCRM